MIDFLQRVKVAPQCARGTILFLTRIVKLTSNTQPLGYKLVVEILMFQRLHLLLPNRVQKLAVFLAKLTHSLPFWLLLSFFNTI